MLNSVLKEYQIGISLCSSLSLIFLTPYCLRKAQKIWPQYFLEKLKRKLSLLWWKCTLNSNKSRKTTNLQKNKCKLKDAQRSTKSFVSIKPDILILKRVFKSELQGKKLFELQWKNIQDWRILPIHKVKKKWNINFW